MKPVERITLEVQRQVGEEQRAANRQTKEERMLLDNQLNAVIAKLSIPGKQEDVEKLEKEYQVLLRKIKKLS